MARGSGPLANAPRDQADDFVGVEAEKINAAEPPRWPRKAKRVKSNTFHSKAEGNTSPKRADRAPQNSPGVGGQLGHFRRGGWVKGRAQGGPTIPDAFEPRDEPTGGAQQKRGGSVKKRQDGGDVPIPRSDPRTRDFMVNRMEQEIPNLRDDPMKTKASDIDRFSRKYGFGAGTRERDLPENVARREGSERTATEQQFLKGYKKGGATKRARGGGAFGEEEKGLLAKDKLTPGQSALNYTLHSPIGSKVSEDVAEEKAERKEHYKKGGALSQVSKETSKGGLHRSLGIPEGQKIGAKRIEVATHSSNPKIRREANLAKTYAKYRP